MNFTKYFSKQRTPQSLPIAGTTQVPNSAGGFAWAFKGVMPVWA